MAPVDEYQANRDKMADFIRQAKAEGCRAVIFPERALYFTEQTPIKEIDAALDDLRVVVDECDLYGVICCWRHDGVKPFNQLIVVDPDGKVLQTYNKLWSDPRFTKAPGIFKIDGVPCAAAICADRWIRSVEELPVMAGAKVLIECSNNFDNEWIDDLGWYWYIPRALRNDVYVVFSNTSADSYQRPYRIPGHGHSAVIAPDGSLLAAAAGESDRMLVTELDLSKATGEEAFRRRNHPLFKPFWETGVAMLDGQPATTSNQRPLHSPERELKIAAAQIACSRQIDENVAKIVEAIHAASAEQADIVVFPELAVTGALEADILHAAQAELEPALATICRAAREAKIHVVCGLPWQEGEQRYNSAAVIDPQGKLLTRYDQVVVDRPDLFATGLSTKAMWFELHGVPTVVTIGKDAAWSEIAEMAALRGAQVHLHLAYDPDRTAEGQLHRQQEWVNLASFNTFTATVNAASPERLSSPSMLTTGGSAIWEGFSRTKAGAEGGYFPHSAVRLREAGPEETILYAQEKVQKSNPHYSRMTTSTNPQMTPWYTKGLEVIYSETTSPLDRIQTQFPD
jgi:predicted amidohydrolase